MTAPLVEVQRYVANLAITTPFFRAKGSAGAMEVAIEFVCKLDLSEPKPSLFAEYLDKHTAALQSDFLPDWRPWGPARKALNVFLRDATYNAFLRSEYNLAALEPVLETPVDSRI